MLKENALTLMPPFLRHANVDMFRSFQFEDKIQNISTDMFLIANVETSRGVGLITSIRQNTLTTLSPVWAIAEVTENSLIPFTDGILENENQIEKIYSNINRYSRILPELLEMRVPEKRNTVQFLLYLLTREIKNLEPKFATDSFIGYCYPPSLIFHDNHEASFENIAMLKEKGVFAEILKDKVNYCPNCNHWTLSFRDICPICRSLDINIEEMIHHYRCANVAKREDFISGDKLVCPKCYAELRHFGLDYDKPSDIFICKDCGNSFTDPEYNALCLTCGTTSSVEELGQKRIFSYALNDSIAYAEIENAVMAHDDLSLVSPMVISGQNGLMEKTYQVEISRLKRYKRNLGIVVVAIKPNQLSGESIKFKKISNAFIEILKSDLRGSDYLFIYKPYMFVSFLTEVMIGGADLVSKRIRRRLEEYQTNEKVKNLEWEIVETEITGETKNTDTLLKEMIDSLMQS